MNQRQIEYWLMLFHFTRTHKFCSLVRRVFTWSRQQKWEWAIWLVKWWSRELLKSIKIASIEVQRWEITAWIVWTLFYNPGILKLIAKWSIYLIVFLSSFHGDFTGLAPVRCPSRSFSFIRRNCRSMTLKKGNVSKKLVFPRKCCSTGTKPLILSTMLFMCFKISNYWKFLNVTSTASIGFLTVGSLVMVFHT